MNNVHEAILALFEGKTYRQLAKEIGISPSSCDRLIREGTLPKNKFLLAKFRQWVLAKSRDFWANPGEDEFTALLTCLSSELPARYKPSGNGFGAHQTPLKKGGQQNPPTQTPPAPKPAKDAYAYTPDEEARVRRVSLWLDASGYSRAALARLARVSAASLSQILSGQYPTSPANLLDKLDSAIRNAAGRETPAAPAAVETSVYRLVHLGCDMARRYRNFAVLTGFVGTGKTFAIKHYAATHPNTTVVEANPCMTPQSLIRHLARQVAGVEKGSIAEKFEQIVGALKDTDSLIVIDEAETLTPHQLHTVRRIRDTANVGVVLAGTEHLSGLIRPAHGQFDQIRSRAGFWPETVKGITAEDAAALAQSAFGAEEVPEDVLARLFAYSKGSARMLTEGLIAALKAFRQGRPLDTRLVDAVAKQALCLQSLA
jgi:DNA transposition AAA+ family ATPase